jgi:hypothetical protein
MAIGDLFGGLSMGFGGFGNLVTIVLIAMTAIMVVGSIIWYFWNRKQWNLVVEVLVPRQVQYLKPGDLLDIENIKGDVGSEVAKGAYNVKRGAVFIKRKGKAKASMKPFNVNQYLFNQNKIKVVQVGAEEYVPILPQSFLLYEDENGNTSALLRLKADATTSKAWRSTFERNSKITFSVVNFLRENQTIIMIGLVIFLWGLQTLILYNRMKGG